ncbi:putative MATE family efflux protein [Altererythrobacter atlanticus]|uniref:Multidrug export protein MepA n=1 Tax=Croceibacterium atlanticum TaxID=1267766 RepID=A0A0F7KSD4_9SPHN|nr:MATE family efflux transporter [Croceibacterium atlanticum]AKH42479.1 Multidrug export protein MepA [Croceibacterium atlanticum]MBB5731256.1 putative MATE family efflux protein [Croceibacterium atlanticum]
MAMKGDLTEGPILRTLIMFSIPTLMSNALQSLSGTVNSIWVGRLIGEEALAATANANIIMFLVSSAAFGFGMAGTVKIGQRFGARNIDGARRAFGTAVGFCSILMVLIAVLGWFTAPGLLTLLETPVEAYELALVYLRLIFISMPFMMVSIILTMGLRGTGDARTPLIFMGVTVVLDAIFNPMLIAGIGPFPRLGIAGSALSTIIASFISFLAMIAYVYRRDLPLRLRGVELRYLKPAREELGFIVGKGLPMGAQMLLMSAAGIIVVGLVNREGLLMTAAYGAAMQLFTYIQMPAMAIGGAVSAMTAQFIGARKWDTLNHVTRAGVLVNFVLTGSVTALLLLFDRPALVLFLGPDSPAVPLARHIQFLASWNFILFGVTMVLTATMRAGGAVWVPLWILGIALYPVRLGFYYLGYDRLGSDAIWLSFPVAAFAALIMAWWAYRYSGWREKAIAETEAEAREQSQADGQPAGRYAPNM